MKSNYQLLKSEIEKGMLGKNTGIPTGFSKLDEHIQFRKSRYILIGANTGVGKTALIDNMILNGYEWYLANKDNTNLKLEVIYRSMERNKTHKLAKWACRKLFLDHHIEVTVDQLLGQSNIMISDRIKSYFDQTEEYFETMQDSGIITIIDGAENPTGIYKHLVKNAESKGKVISLSQYERIYEPDDPNLITLVIIDHIGKCKLENIGGQYSRKLTSDKLSEYMGLVRDFYGYSPVVVSQFNREISDPIRLRNGDVEPKTEDFKDSSNSQEDADMIISLFNPYRYKIFDHMDYDINKFIDKTNGSNKFRSVKILKNSFGVDDVRVGLGFMGNVGIIKEIPSANKITKNDYDSIINNSHFYV